uniref:Sulfhydryl oxidase n=1 Tax=Macrostomum lignano TaxID=282301 RepID=A0A1I8FCH3_9PLAT
AAPANSRWRHPSTASLSPARRRLKLITAEEFRHVSTTIFVPGQKFFSLAYLYSPKCAQCYNPLAHLPTAATQALPPKPPPTKFSDDICRQKACRFFVKTWTTTSPDASGRRQRPRFNPSSTIRLPEIVGNQAENLLRMTPPGGSAVKWRHLIAKMNDAEKRATALAKLLANSSPDGLAYHGCHWHYSRSLSLHVSQPVLDGLGFDLTIWNATICQTALACLKLCRGQWRQFR